MGQVIPGWTGRRVIYGHPYETVDAAVEKKIVQDYFAGKMSQREVDLFFAAKKIDYIFLDQAGRPIEPASGSSVVVYSNQDVTIYQVGKEP